MNKDRRKQIAEAIEMLENAKSIIEEARDDEQDYFDNMHENFQNGEKGEQAQAAIDSLDETYNSIEDAIGTAEMGAE